MCLSISTQGKPQLSNGALDDQQLLAIEGSKKKSRQAGTQPLMGESEKCCQKSAIKKNLRRTIAINHLITPVKLQRSASAPRQDGDTLSMNCSCESLWPSEPPNHGDLLLRHDDLVEKATAEPPQYLHHQDHGDLPVRHDRDGENLVSELHLRNLHNQVDNGNLPLRYDRDEDLVKGSNNRNTPNWSMNCNCGNSTVFCTSSPGTRLAPQRARQPPCPACGNSKFSALWTIPTSTTCTTGTSTTLFRKTCGFSRTPDVHGNGHVNTLSKNCTCGISTD